MPDDSHSPASYGERIASAYDAMHSHLDPAPAVEALVRLARGGRVLELGIGTGRIALPLAARGVEVHGVDASEAMVAELRAKPGGAEIPVTIGDFPELPVEGRFEVVAVPFNTFFALLTQEEQLRCFASVAEHLAPGGVFVIEAFVPDLTLYEHGRRLSTSRILDDGVVLDAASIEPATQRISARLLHVSDGSIEVYPVEIRYAWPSELDLMARLAGLRLRERWGSWSGEAFTSASRSHVSVYEAAQPSEDSSA